MRARGGMIEGVAKGEFKGGSENTRPVLVSGLIVNTCWIGARSSAARIGERDEHSYSRVPISWLDYSRAVRMYPQFLPPFLARKVATLLEHFGAR